MSEKWSKIGVALWDEAVPIAGTLSETYLKESRRISLPLGPDVARHHPAAAHPKLKSKMPALIVKVSGSAEPAFGLTFLAPDGLAKAMIDRKEQRRTLGSNRGGAVHLGEPQPGKALLIAEGLEERRHWGRGDRLAGLGDFGRLVAAGTPTAGGRD